MILSGTLIGFICVVALFMASLLMAYLDKKEKAKGNTTQARFFSRVALTLFFLAFVSGVTVTLLGGIKPRVDDPHPQMGRNRTASQGLSGDAQGEAKKLQEKIKNAPQDTISRERLAHLYLQSGDYEKVFQLTHEVLQVKPESVESRVHMGMVLFSMQEVDSAIAQIDQALAKDPQNLEGLAFKGLIQLNGQNKPEEAKKTWQKYLKKAKEGDVGWGMVNALMGTLSSS
ncbi:MAG: hypothetical protein HYT76_01130 [Deltaproteobacteria bacterium]|nr:hypothetical protein [Deltaproteobacteria bacterium]